MKIANKITFSFLTTGIIFIVAAASIFYLSVRDSLQEEIGRYLEIATKSRARHIETYLEMLEISVGQLSKSVVLADLLEADKGGHGKKQAFDIAMLRLKRTREANPAIDEFLLLDAGGRVVASTNEASIGADKFNDAIFTGAQKKIYIKDAYFFQELKKPLLAVSSPIVDSQTQEFIGVIASRAQLTDLDNIVTDRSGMGETGEIYIVNKYGFMITPSRFLKETFLKQKVDTLNLKDCQAHKNEGYPQRGKKEITAALNYRGVMVLGAHEYLPKMQWSVLGEIGLREAYLPLAKIRRLFAAILLLVLAVSWLTGAFLSRLITGPLRKLHKGTEIIGAGNLDYRVGTSVKDEVGQLSRAFDQMAGGLKKSREALEDWGRTLEERVKERTKELDQTQEASLNILEDLTEAKEKLEEAISIKTDFTSMVSHELRTPLSAIKESIAIVGDGTAGEINAEQKEFLTMAKRNVDRLARLINDVLTFQKLETGRPEFNLTEHDINDVAGEVRNAMFSLAQGKGIEISLKLDETMPKVKFDRDKIIQVLSNLLNNAIKYTEKGSIIITISHRENIARVEVQDSGPGIKKEDIPRLFQKFSQLESVSERKTGSTGLGLAISRQIIEAHKGKIWAESEVGKGATFIFVLPIKDRRG